VSEDKQFDLSSKVIGFAICVTANGDAAFYTSIRYGAYSQASIPAPSENTDEIDFFIQAPVAVPLPDPAA
jgi:hypothetical protein